MAYEIDFMPVGTGTKSGDAIALRRWDGPTPKNDNVVVLDGGTKESGDALVEHIRQVYGTDLVEAAICTHSDADHASGLTEVLENLKVGRLFMHQPWNHVEDLEDRLAKASITDDASRHFRKSLAHARDLEALAKKKGIQIVEPFSDTIPAQVNFVILGPSTVFYEALLKNFRCVDELTGQVNTLLQKILGAPEKIVKWLEETWDGENLLDPSPDDCSAENNSSVILLLRDTRGSFLFTSDAGVPALDAAADEAVRQTINLKSLTGIQVPHHGSKHNVGPTILDRIIGPKLKSASFTKSAIVSASVDGAPKHPSRRVVNALKRRGAEVLATQGNAIRHSSVDAPIRPGWTRAVPLPFYDRDEE